MALFYPTMLVLVFLLLSGLLLPKASSESTTFSFPSFNNESCSNGALICMGSVTSGDGYLSITPEPEQSNATSAPPLAKVGRVLYSHPVLAWPAIISTTFTVRMSAFLNYTGAGDGMAFLMAQDNTPSPPASHGSYIGLIDRSTGGVVKQVAVVMDTYMNEFDTDGNHISIITTSITSPVAAKSLTPTGIDLKSGKDITIKVIFDGLRNMLCISVANAGNPLLSFLNQSLPISDTVPATVYVGFTGSTGTLTGTHRVLNWEFTSWPLPHRKSKSSDGIKTILIAVLPTVIGLLIAVVCGVFFGRRILRRRNERVNKRGDIESLSRSAANMPKMFTYKQLSNATCNFSKENLLGVGGFGSVYKGIMRNPPATIAVKKISATSAQGEKEYLAEICTIGRIRHKNIVQLQGWCHENQNLLLVYEYLPNGSLDRYIGTALLDWKTRYQILSGLASALLYLHQESGNPVVHRDVKPNNVMLDSHFIPHLGDFGLARLLQNDDAAVTTMLAGTPGYLAPEVGYTGKATPESDVYSFGMVVLQVVCGRRYRSVMEQNGLVDYVWNLHEKNAIVESLDGRMEGEVEEEEVRRTLIVGLACLHPDSGRRPKMRKVVQIFMNRSEDLMELPEKKPTGVYVPVGSFSASSSVEFSGVSSQVVRNEI